ncbi:MAG TPA: 3-methyl-2-oxobutanoate dehydrogenase subunit VorB [Thermoanaerobaculia bacterium]|nr:3-methyl-2-oxobutanoate dehydrogenase subunit VorB [Thermoanaerobaculia bacterium]
MSPTAASPPVRKEKPKPFLLEEYCKGCGRCIDACNKHCITAGTDINPLTGLVPVHIDLDACNGCALCIDACPEPYGLRATPAGLDEYELHDPATLFGAKQTTAPRPVAIPDRQVALPGVEPLVIKGTYASSVGALLAGCRHFFGYPITPSTEGAELMARLLPKLDGVFIQAVSEVATVNMMYGAGGAGMRSMTFTSSPGFSLMLEGISYMIGAQIPGVFVNIMRGGPGLGNIGPEQSDLKLACRGLGHGNTQAICLTPSTPQEMLDLTILAFELAFRYRNPVVILGDGYLGQMTGKVRLPASMVVPGMPEWAVHGDAMHRRNVNTSIYLTESDLEAHNAMLNAKYELMSRSEQRADLFHTDDAEVLIVACNTPARMAKGAVEALRRRGIRAGLFRPITVWPFPIDQLRDPVRRARRLVVVEASNGQLEDEMRLALSKAGIREYPEPEPVRRMGGMLPQMDEIVARVIGGEVRS